MGRTGTEVAKEASDLILLDDNFGSIVAGVEEGKNILRTIKKVVLYLFSTSLGELLTIFATFLIGWPLPILAVQILWLNLVTDGFLDVALAMEPKENNLLMHRPWTGAGLASFPQVYEQYKLDKHTELLLYAHNIFLDFWAQLGILGLIWLILILAKFFISLADALRKIASLITSSATKTSLMHILPL